MISFITEELIKNGTISENDRELYSYGLKQGLILIGTWSVVFFEGFLLHMFFQTILFSLAFVMLRSSAGGVHTSTQITCFITTLLLFVVILETMKILSLNNFVVGIIAVICGIIIFIFAPVEDLNKPMDEIEQVVFRRRAVITLAIELLILCISCVIGVKILTECVLYALVVVSASLIMGIIKNKFLLSKISKNSI